MGDRRHVFLDPDGTWDDDWMYVVIEERTGVVYQTQYGGTACRKGEVEGFLVPVTARPALAALRELFEVEFRGSGTWRHAWSDDERERLRRIVSGVGYWMSDGTTDTPQHTRLDESRMDDVDEAWVPVLTPDGPGMLLWFNSD